MHNLQQLRMGMNLQEMLKQQEYIWDDANRLTKSNDNQWKELVSDNNDYINKDYLHIRQDLKRNKTKCI